MEREAWSLLFHPQQRQFKPVLTVEAQRWLPLGWVDIGGMMANPVPLDSPQNQRRTTVSVREAVAWASGVAHHLLTQYCADASRPGHEPMVTSGDARRAAWFMGVIGRDIEAAIGMARAAYTSGYNGGASTFDGLTKSAEQRVGNMLREVGHVFAIPKDRQVTVQAEVTRHLQDARSFYGRGALERSRFPQTDVDDVWALYDDLARGRTERIGERERVLRARTKAPLPSITGAAFGTFSNAEQALNQALLALRPVTGGP